MLICKDRNNTVRWHPGERLHHLYEQKCDELERTGRSGHPAAIADGRPITYRELDNRANQLARYLLSQDVRPGDRVALLLGKSVLTYVALLAVLKAGAAYVPLDASFPEDRIAYILNDANAKAILTISAYRAGIATIGSRKVFLDEIEATIASQSTERLGPAELGQAHDELAYIIYTSGSTGHPKGVAIEHPSICNFVKVAAEVYGYREDDRVYQGMTIAFDFSVEELWVPLAAGATLVPGTPSANLLGRDLADFLLEQKITALCCVPTLLASIGDDIAGLRFLLVSGEACPRDLVARWSKPGRTFINAYGPTEATVTCTWTDLMPGEPVTIGRPMPTYAVVILEENQPIEVANGATGEICVAGIGLARGYVNRADLTARAFIPDGLDLPNNPSKRIYRTGDLGRITENGKVEFLGRVDTQVKVRGYRIDLTEIESVFLDMPQVAQAVADTYDPGTGTKELVAYYTLREGFAELPTAKLSELLQNRLPAYMIPTFVEKLDSIPMLASHKADRKSLPKPAGPRFVAPRSKIVGPRTETERLIVNALAEVLGVEKISVDDNFFRELGAHSLLMAQMAARLRQKLPDINISMRAIYLNPTVAELATFIDTNAKPQGFRAAPPIYRIPSNLEYYGCGALQVLTYLASGVPALWLPVAGFHWAFATIGGPIELYLRVVAFLIAAYFGLSFIAIAAKWLLVGRWKEQTFPIWSLSYFRFWLIKGIVSIAPMALFPGGPVYNAYLRLLGARIGRDVVIRSSAPVCTDLFSVGNGTIIRERSLLPGYTAESNYIRTGPIGIGNNAFVGSGSVVDVDTVMEDNTQLGHSSCLQRGQRIGEGRHYHGTPAQETQVDYCTIETRDCGAFRRWLYSVVVAGSILGVLIPLPVMVFHYLLPDLLGYAAGYLNYDAPPSVFLAQIPKILLVSLALFFGLFVTGLFSVYLLPRLANLFLEEGRTYGLFGLHYYMQGLVSALSNSSFFNLLFGDSSYIVHYLKWVGYELNKIKQTGANFGLDQVHDNPFLCDIGSGSMVSDGLAMQNTEMSSTSFRLGKVKIGDHNYLGNNILYPAAGKTGVNVLLATKVMVPIDGPVRENVGLLGSPAFEIPRVVDRDRELALICTKSQRDGLRRKNNFNIVTMALYMMSNFILFFVIIIFNLIWYYETYDPVFLLASGTFTLLFSFLFFVLMEWASLGFKTLLAKEVSLYDPYFWFHERHWKFCGHPLMSLFAGTPMKNVLTRMLGVKLGRKIFDDGAHLYDKTLLEIGDYTNLNLAAVVQGHSLEEGAFKSDRVRIGKGCTLACGAFVHYGVIMSENAVLGPNAFLMKGERVPPNSVWQGNPARMV